MTSFIRVLFELYENFFNVFLNSENNCPSYCLCKWTKHESVEIIPNFSGIDNVINVIYI